MFLQRKREIRETHYTAVHAFTPQNGLERPLKGVIMNVKEMAESAFTEEELKKVRELAKKSVANAPKLSEEGKKELARLLRP